MFRTIQFKNNLIIFLAVLSIHIYGASKIQAQQITTYTVTNTNTDGEGSLQKAIATSNTLTEGEKRITFAIPDTDPNYQNGVWTISIESTQSAILNNNITVDGFSQQGSSPNQTPHKPDQVLKIAINILNGSWNIQGNNNTLRGLDIITPVNTDSSIPNLIITGDSNIISDSFIGINSTQECPRNPDKVVIVTGKNNIIQSSTAIGCASNVSGNYSIEMNGTGTIRNSYINTNAHLEKLSGNGILVNAEEGDVYIENNIISGNSDSLLINSVSTGTQPTIQITNNFFGTNFSRSAILNTGQIYITGNYPDNPITSFSFTDNVITNNTSGEPLENFPLSYPSEMPGVLILNSVVQATISNNSFIHLYGHAFFLYADDYIPTEQNTLFVSVSKNTFSDIRGSAMVFYEPVSKSKTVLSENTVANTALLGIDRELNELTANDEGDVDQITNFPIITNATTDGKILNLEGFSRAGSKVEVYSTTNSTLFVSGELRSGFASGQQFIGSFVEGSAEDTDSSVGYYIIPPSDTDWTTYKGIYVGRDTTEKFKVALPLSQPLAIGSYITTTATLNSTTSEFSPSKPVILYSITLTSTPSIAPSQSPSSTPTPTPGPTGIQPSPTPSVTPYAVPTLKPTLIPIQRTVVPTTTIKPTPTSIPVVLGATAPTQNQPTLVKDYRNYFYFLLLLLLPVLIYFLRKMLKQFMTKHNSDTNNIIV
ncbi:MAG: hypothetical protein WCO06_05560 [Candidatus Roizmanbacteria bacterium]